MPRSPCRGARTFLRSQQRPSCLHRSAQTGLICYLPTMSNSDSTKLRWGILGTGNIARQFAAGVRTGRRAILAAVGSRTASSARTFADAHNIPTAFGTYDALLGCREIDAVYLSLPNSMHHEWTLKALSAGKHVLCETPIAASAAQAQAM